MATRSGSKDVSIVHGKVTNSNNRALANLKVEIFDADMRSWHPLAHTYTDKDGKYSLQWEHGKVSDQERGTADIAVKVYTREKNTELYKSDVEGIRFNAENKEEINIIIEAEIPAEIVEFNFLVEEVSSLAHEVAISDLKENDEHQDISFLSNELGVPAQKLEHLIVANKVFAKYKLDADFIYALLRKNTLLDNNVSPPSSARLSVELNSNISIVLYDAALVDEKIIMADVGSAISEMIVPSSIRKNIANNIKKLASYKKEAEDYYQKDYPEKMAKLIASILQPGKLDKLHQDLSKTKNDQNSFFDKIADPSLFDTNNKEDDTQVTIDLGKLIGLGNVVIPQVIKARKIKSPKDIKKLARLNKAAWVEEISTLNPKLKNKKAINNYSSMIVRRLENEFPTAAFTAQLEREGEQVVNNQNEVIDFLNKYEDFDLVNSNIDLFQKKKRMSKKKREMIGEELKSLQRVFKLTPNYRKTLALRNEKIHSSYSIVATGKTQFVNDIAPKVGLSMGEAKAIYHKAETRHIAAMLMAGDLQDSMSTVDIASFETKSLVQKLKAVSTDFPNLKSLFKLIDTCECKHCRSVCSPSAYLVELLQFIGKRSVVLGNAKSVLFQRRPDLGDIDLSCANSNTPVKYIDLVCELLENIVAPNNGISYSGNLSVGQDAFKGKIANELLVKLQTAGLPVTPDAIIYETETREESSENLPYYLRDTKLVCKIIKTGGSSYRIFQLRQTLSTAEELDAAPEYVNEKAYDKLRVKTFAFNLPFDLSHTEAKAYFDRFGVNRADLMKVFKSSSGPEEFSIAAERLDITDAERKIITETPIPNLDEAQQLFWNVPPGKDPVDYLKRVDHFLNRTGIFYRELDLLLRLTFIDKTKNLFIKHDDLTCNTTTKNIDNFHLDALDRIHRFLRLQKITDIDYEVLDAIISQSNLGGGDLDDACLINVSQLKDIATKTGIRINELIGCFGEFPYTIRSEDTHTPLYLHVFQNKARNGMIDDGLSPEKLDGTQFITPLKASISTCLQVTEYELETLLPLLPDTGIKLTFSNLSYLFSASLFIKKLKLKIDDFASLMELTGFNLTSSPRVVLEFIEIIKQLNKSSLSAVDVKFILNHKANNLNELIIAEDKIKSNLIKLKEEYLKINEEFQSLFNVNLSAEEQKEVLINIVSTLAGVTEDNIKTIIKFLDKKGGGTAVVKGIIKDNFDKTIEKAPINAAIDALDAVNANVDFKVEQNNLVKALLDSISKFQIEMSKRAILEQILSDSFRADKELMNTVLSIAQLKQQVLVPELILNILSDNFNNDISSANYPKQYAALKLLHKMLYLFTALELSNESIQWYFKHNKALSWFELDSIPYDVGQTDIEFEKYVAFLKVIHFTKMFPSVVNLTDIEKPISFFTIWEQLLTSDDPAPKEKFIKTLAILTGFESDRLSEVDEHIFPVFDKGNYRNVNALERLLACTKSMNKLGVTVSHIKNYIKPSLKSGDVNSLRTALKARYDEETWLSTLKEIMDTIRPQKRDALVAYLLATKPDIKDENDLYDNLLVDVEMESCMPSSRIVLAHNSIQLFVQRCLMGLEPKAIANVEKDPGWNQWQWMKNYRVWEANRKVFLYPENWYEPALSDDKSYLLTELINDLQQNELTTDSAEGAFKDYLEKLDSIAFLEVMATWYDVSTKNMHVFARSKGGDPAFYFYRRFENERYWTPWEKVDLEISGDHLLAFMRNNKMHLAWLIFSEDAEPKNTVKVPEKEGQKVDINVKVRHKIQIVISEFSNNKWQPKKMSKDYVTTPTYYLFRGDLNEKEKFSLVFLQHSDQIIIFETLRENEDQHRLSGIFKLAGCKGYPELFEMKKNSPRDLPKFLPEFKDAGLGSQRYTEITEKGMSGELAVKNALYRDDFLVLLKETPGKFRISYSHQFSNIDLPVFLIFQMQMRLYGGTHRNRISKIPYGTLLPYFKEDSSHAYVITPGFYRREIQKERIEKYSRFNDSEKRTVSDIYKLMDDVVTWYKKVESEFRNNPPIDNEEKTKRIISDREFLEILEEISKYELFDTLISALIGKTRNAEFDSRLVDLKGTPGWEYGEQFKNMYHPLVCALGTILVKDGIPGLLSRETQLLQSGFDFNKYYDPNENNVPKSLYKKPNGEFEASYPIENIDFDSDGSYSSYNWDLFFRVPLHIAVSLTKNQRFEEALTWFHYMFNPTGALPGNPDNPENDVQKYWVTKPFYLNQKDDYLTQRIDSLLYSISPSSSESSNPDIKELEFAISQWREKPFRPDVIARFRPVAYQKSLLMKYIDNLTEWGDYLFRQDSMESVAQATQMYILADKLLGPKPKIVPQIVKNSAKTYNQLEANLDSFGNALIELENILPELSVLPEDGVELPSLGGTLSMHYFCIPPNEVMREYWDRVADRLFKIRHCQNIDGIERSLALFAPPIDPGMLVRATASGLSISSVLAGMNAPTPYYRFNVLSQKATELAQETRSLGASLLQALEKKDVETIALLRSKLEIKVLNSITDIKKLQISEATEQIEILNRTKKVTEERHSYYASIQKISSKEQLNLDKLSDAKNWQLSAQASNTLAGAMSLLPDLVAGGSGFGGSPHVTVKWGGMNLMQAARTAGDVFNIFSSLASYEANKASILGGYDRRFDDWQLQERLTNLELESIDKQIIAAEIRKELTETELKNHELQINNLNQTDEFMRSKFTNKELYDWMVAQISSVYFKAYQLAHDFAKKAERCYRFELANDDSFIEPGYWDSMKKGLQSADQLIHDIKRMEASYIDHNKREYEITKHVSLSMLDPVALVRLKATGLCNFDVPEVFYDIDHPGQYFRRIKSVSLSLPCIAGPYTSVSAKLSLVNNRYRKKVTTDNYAEDLGKDERFVYNIGAIQSISTSNSQNDSGVFELNFRDERYLPFEGTGAISSWRLELPTKLKQFDFNTISDVILHIKYTAREGGSQIKTLANSALEEHLALISQDLDKSGLHRAINLNQELPNEWHMLINNGKVNITIDKSRLPYMAQNAVTIKSVTFIVKVKSNPANSDYLLKINKNVDVTCTPLKWLETDNDWLYSEAPLTGIKLGTQFELSISSQLDKLEGLMIIVKYGF